MIGLTLKVAKYGVVFAAGVAVGAKAIRFLDRIGLGAGAEAVGETEA